MSQLLVRSLLLVSTPALLATGFLALSASLHAREATDDPHATLTKAEALEDLEIFAKRLGEEGAYLALRESRPFESVEELRRRLPDSISASEFARELRKILSPIGDCHSSITCAADDDEPGLWLPFRLASACGGIIAVNRDYSSFVAPDHPYLVEVDGWPLQDWLDAALKYAPVGSGSQNLYAALKGIRRIDILRRDLGIAESTEVALVFANAEGERRQMTLPCRNRFSSLAEIRLGVSRRIGESGESGEIGEIGYLRLPAMDDDLVPGAKRLMDEFRDTEGLVIDLRGNGGGRYGLLRALFGYFQPPEDGPFVCNVAAFRLAPRFRSDHIEYRPTHRRDWPGWSEEDGAAIDAIMAGFEPGFPLPREQFSDWHFMVLKRENSHWHYDRPVIVLCDERCVSASDGFLAAFSLLPQVTLMGVGSRGASGSSRSVRLPRSGIDFKLSTMVSFRPDGRPFEGIGVAVDVPAQPCPEDFIADRDSVLEQALESLRPPLTTRGLRREGSRGNKKDRDK